VPAQNSVATKSARKIGEGGMGQVYLVEDTQLRRRVALKILRAAIASNEDRMRYSLQEAQAAAALNHPNIAHISLEKYVANLWTEFTAFDCYAMGANVKECKNLIYVHGLAYVLKKRRSRQVRDGDRASGG
jgi:serine/threonine protein kinase